MRVGKRIWPAGRSVRIADAIRAAGGEVQLVGKVGDDLAGDAIVIELGRRSIGHSALARAGSGLTPVVARASVGEDDADDRAADDGPADDGATSEAIDLGTEREAGAGADGGPAASGAADGKSSAAPPVPAGMPLEGADLKLALGYLPEIGAIVLATALPDDAVGVVADAAAYHSVPLVAVVDAGTRPGAGLEQAIVLEAPRESGDAFDRLVGAFAVRLERGTEATAAFDEAVAAGGWERTSGSA